MFNKIFEDLQIYSVTKNGLGVFNPDNFKLDTRRGESSYYRRENYERGGDSSYYRRDNYKKGDF